MNNYAGEFLKLYEISHYILSDWFGFKSIVIPPGAEELADVSFYQPNMNWDEYQKHARAAILRLGQGQWTDTEFEKNYSETTKRGILVGGYWFYDGRVSPVEQYNKIVEILASKKLDMELFIDWERDYSGKYEGLKNVTTLMKLLDKAGLDVRAIGIYTGYYWFKEHPDTTQHEYLKNKPLWIAWYASPSIVKIPEPWTNWLLWQKGTPVLKWGQPTAEIDLDVFNGTKKQFEDRYINPVPDNTHLLEVFVDKTLVFTKTI